MSAVIRRACYRILSALPFCAIAGLAQSSEVYAFVDSQGKLVVSEQKRDSRYVRFDPTKRVTPRYVTGKTSWVVTKSVSVTYRPVQQANSVESRATNAPTGRIAQQRYAPLINSIAQEIGVDANLLHAIIQVESAYNPLAISPKGAQGLMQLIPATAARFGVDQSFEPADNVRGGARYIKNLLTLFNNDLQLALAAYNAGEGAVKKYNNTIPPYPETQAYVTRVLSLFGQPEN